MSLSNSLTIANTGLQVAQESIRITSNNVSNVNSPNFVRKIVQQEALVAGGNISGVGVSRILRNVDEFLDSERLRVIGEVKQLEARSEIHDQLQSLFGDPSAKTSISGRLDVMFNAISDLGLEPDSVVRQLQVINDINAFGDELQRLAEQVQNIRTKTENSVTNSVEEVNNLLVRVHEVNQIINTERSLGRDTSALEEQRYQHLSELSEQVDIRTYEKSNGTMVVTTGTGILLVEDVLFQLHYDATSQVGTATAFDDIEVRQVVTSGNDTGAVANGTNLNVDTVGQDLEPALKEGKLLGYLKMRDQELPALAEQLGQLAQKVADEMNKIHNQHTGVPPSNQLTGLPTGITGADSPGFSSAATKSTVTIDASTNNVVFTNTGTAFTIQSTGLQNQVIPNGSLITIGASTVAEGADTFRVTGYDPNTGTVTLQSAEGQDLDTTAFATGTDSTTNPMTVTIQQRAVTTFMVTDKDNNTVKTVMVDWTQNPPSMITDTNATKAEDVATDFASPSAIAGGNTISDVTTAINAQLGNLGTLSFVNGKMEFKATDPQHGVIIVDGRVDETGKIVDQSQRGGRDFSTFFRMNDLITLAPASTHFETGLSGTDKLQLEGNYVNAGDGIVEFDVRGPRGETAVKVAINFDTSGTLNTSKINELRAQGYQIVEMRDADLANDSTVDNDVTMQEFVNFLNSQTTISQFVNLNLNDSGKVDFSMKAAFSDHRIVVTNDRTVPADNVTRADGLATRGKESGLSFTKIFGVGQTNVMDAAFDFQVKDGIRLDTRNLSLSTVESILLPSQVPGTNPAVQPGNSKGSDAMAAVGRTLVSFDSAGDLFATTQTLSQYSASIIQRTSVNAQQTEFLQEHRKTLGTELQRKWEGQAGVNIDEEMSNLILYQNSYTASARVVTTVTKMFDTLLNIV